MKLAIESKIDTDSLILINSVVYKLKHTNLNGLKVILNKTIISNDLEAKFVCGRGSDHVWVQRKHTDKRIILITRN